MLPFVAWKDGRRNDQLTDADDVEQRFVGDRPLYPVYIRPQGDLPDGLFPGMTVDAAIIVEQRTDVLRLPRSPVRAAGAGTATVEVWTGRAAEARLEPIVALRYE